MDNKYYIHLLLSIGILFGARSAAYAQETEETKPHYSVEAKVGLPLGYSDFSSLGNNHFSPGIGAGFAGNYHFNHFLSAGAAVGMGVVNMTARAPMEHYWYCEGGRYVAPVFLRENYSYKDLRVKSFFGYASLNVGLNLVSLFAGKPSRFDVSLRPSIYLLGVRSKLEERVGGTELQHHGFKFSPAYGGLIGLSYAMTNKMDLLLTEEVMFAGDKNRIDGLAPVYDKNFLATLSVGVRFRWGKAGNKMKSVPQATQADRPVPVNVAPAPAVPEEKAVPTDTLQVESPAQMDKVAKERMVNEELANYNIYFKLDVATISPDQYVRVDAIADLIRRNPEMTLLIEGWTDPLGTREYNKRLSFRRAEALQKALIARGIKSEYVRITGQGIDTDAPTHKEARRTNIYLKEIIAK